MKVMNNSASSIASPGNPSQQVAQGFPTDLKDVVACLKMMPPGDAAQLLEKLADVVQTGSQPMTAEGTARVSAEVAELTGCLKMMGNDTPAIATLRKFAGLPSALGSSSVDAFQPSAAAATMMSTGAGPLAAAPSSSVGLASQSNPGASSAPEVVQWSNPVPAPSSRV